MAKNKQTSYERVYHALFETETCKEAWEEALANLEIVKITEVKWSLSTGEHSASAKASFVLSHECGSWPEDQLGGCMLSAFRFMTNELARKITDTHYGSDKDVKTFNCNGSIVRGGGQVSRKNRWDERERVHQESFHSFLTNRFEEKAGEALQKATNRLRAEAKTMMETADFKKARHEALVEFCKDHITKALLPWQGMEDSVLQDAWDRFVCTAIMDP